MGTGKNPSSSAGICFPLDSKGQPSTTSFAKNVWAEAMKAAGDSDGASSIKSEKDWRHKYDRHVVRLAEKQMESKATALASARAGLEALHSTILFKPKAEGATALPLSEVMAQPPAPSIFESKEIKGSGSAGSVSLHAMDGGAVQSGAEAVAEVSRWVKADIVEADVETAVRGLVDNPEWIEASRQKIYVLIGGTSEMCPLKTLLALGCTVVAIQRPSCRVQKLIDFARSSAGTLILPVPKTSNSDVGWEQAAGADILCQPAELRDWLLTLYPGKQLVVGSYIYLDGEAHVRASAAMDAVVSSLVALRGSDGTCLAYLTSPATVYPVPHTAVAAAQSRLNTPPWWYSLAALLTSPLKGWSTNVPQPPHLLYNGLAVLQGPNYALAKTLQNWRCMVAHADGVVVSANIAPASKTDSVMHVPAMARGMLGLDTFEPLKAFEPSSASTIMALLLLHDIGNPKSAANPTSGEVDHPLRLFESYSVHGGFWRFPYSMESIGVATYCFGLFK